MFSKVFFGLRWIPFKVNHCIVLFLLVANVDYDAAALSSRTRRRVSQS